MTRVFWLLTELAKTTQNAGVRRQVMSSLGRSRDPRALAFFEDVLKRYQNRASGPPMAQSTRTRACEARAFTTNFWSAVTSDAPSRSASAR